MRIIVGQDRPVAEWVAKKLGGPHGEFIPPYVSLGIIDEGGTLRGGFVIRPINCATCDLSLYSEGALTHGAVRAMFRILFGRLGFARCVIHTRRDNKATKRGAPKLGFKFECKAVDFYGPGVDALQFSMTRNSCRWLVPNGQPIKSLPNAEGADGAQAGGGDRSAAGREHVLGESTSSLQPA